MLISIFIFINEILLTLLNLLFGQYLYYREIFIIFKNIIKPMLFLTMGLCYLQPKNRFKF